MRLTLLLILAYGSSAGFPLGAHAWEEASSALAGALDQPDWVFETGGAAPWFPQTEESHDGQDAARSGAIADNQESWVETASPGEGTLTFWWKVSSENRFDYLEFYIDDIRQDRISGETNWTQKTYFLEEGDRTLRWRYTKDSSVNAGKDRGWVDEVGFEPSDPMTVSPKGPWEITGFASFPVSATRVYSVSSEGADPLSWSVSSTVDWLKFSGMGGTGSTGEVTVKVGGRAVDLPVGVHEGELVFVNTGTGAERIRNVILTLLPEPGSVEVTDSIAPADDREVPFGEVSAGLTKRETIRVSNSHPENDLQVSRIQLRPVPGEAPTGASGATIVSTTSDAGPAASASGSGQGGRRKPPPADWSRDHDETTILVRFKEEAALSARGAVHGALSGRVAHTMSRIPLDVVELPATANPRAMIAAYQKHPNVEYAEPNYILSIDNLPDDPRFPDLWGLENDGDDGGVTGADISALDAWGWTRGSEEIVVAVIDTGIDYEHPDLAANMWINPSPTFGDVHGATWTNGNGGVTNGDPMDGAGHGTHVAGTIGAIGNNGVGVVGVNWKVRLMALKFLDDTGTGTTADAIAAIEYAIEHGAHVANASWGGGGFSQALEDAIAAAGEANQLFVAAAGNENSNNDSTPSYPASYQLDNIISVASSTRADEKSSFSSYGINSVHLAAPGSDILSTLPDASYGTFSGTSMAAPHVAGVAALILSLNPSAEYGTIKNAILEGVTPLPHWENLVISGGRLNAIGALNNVVKEYRLEGLPSFPVTLTPGRSLVLEVFYEPREPGVHEAVILIESQDMEEPSLQVQLSGAGVLDALEIVEPEHFTAEGFVSGPFEPASQSYTLRNSGSRTLSWTATAPAWLTATPEGGELNAGEEARVEIATNSTSHSFPAGLHQGTVDFSNVSSGLTQKRQARLDVWPWPGRLSVTDSAPPEDDLEIPFGQLSPGEENSEAIILYNADEENGLIIHDLLLLGGYREDFDASYLLGWEQSPVSAWSVAGGDYRASAPNLVGFMQSNYVEEIWYDAMFRVRLSRSGGTSSAAALLLRASADFDLGLGRGTAIVVGVSGNGSYYIARFIGGALQWIQPWTQSTALNLGSATNVIAASIKSDQLHVFANDALLWSGKAGGIFRPGRFGIAAYTAAPSTEHRFDYVEIQEPLAENTLPLTLSQSWLNAHPDENGQNYAELASPASIEPIPAEKRSGEEPLDYAQLLNRQDVFSLPDLPATPFQMDATTGREVFITFAPSGEADFTRTLRILSNDPDEPSIDLLLSGSSERDSLRLLPPSPFLAEGEVGGPFIPARANYTLLNRGGESLSWEIGNRPAWLTIEPVEGRLTNGDFAEIEISVDASAENLPIGTHSRLIEFVNANSGFARAVPMTIEVRPRLCQGLEACDLSWTTGGNAAWFAQDRVTLRTDFAAQSGALGDNEESWIETVVEGPGRLSFWWMVSSEANFDFLEFHINGERQTRIGGDVSWHEKIYELPEGEQTLRWKYKKDFVFTGGEDAGWLDEVTWTPTAPKRIISTGRQLLFGVVPLNESATRTLQVKNTGDSSLSISSVSLPPDFSGDWETATLPPASSREFTITFSPTSVGRHEGILVFTSNATSGIPEVELSGSAVSANDAMELENHEVVAGLAGAKDHQTHFLLEVPEGRESLEVRIFGGTGDADLYVRHEAQPTLDEWDYRPFQVGNNEALSIGQPAGGSWYFMMHAFEEFSEVSITARFAALTFDSWAALIDLPAGSRNLMDRHGPLNLTALQGYGFGRDPRILTGADLPRMERSSDAPGEVRVIYRVQTDADDVSVEIEVSDDLTSWEVASPASEAVLSVSEGVELREAVFEVDDRPSFFIRAMVRHEGS